MVFGGKRFGIVVAVLLTAALAAPAIALAAANSLTIKAPRRPKLGVKFDYKVLGRSRSAGNNVATFLNTGILCKKTFKKELASPYGVTEQTVAVPKGSFTVRATVTPRSTGKHYICAYLYRNNARETTIVRASRKYVTRP